MINLTNLTKKEISQQFHSEIIYFVLFVLMVICFFTSWAQYSAYKNDSNDLIQTYQVYKKSNTGPDSTLNSDSSITRSESNSSIATDFKTERIKVKQDLIEMAPRNSVDHILSSTMFMIFPATMVVYTICFAYRDLKNHQLKIKLSMNSIQSVILSKLISLSIVTFISLIFVCLSSFIFQLGFNNFIHIPNKLSFIQHLTDGKSYLPLAPIQLLAVLALTILPVVVSYYLTLLLRNPWLAGVAISGYFAGMPILGTFDFKHNALLIYRRLFHENITFSPIKINGDFTFMGFVGCCVMVLLFSLIIHYIVTRKKYLTRVL